MPVISEQVAAIRNEAPPGLKYAGSEGMWMALNPTDAPLFLRDMGTRDIYALPLDVK
jgi:hypothetical protein